MNSQRIVVVGAGLSGLAASYDLARAGYQVTLLEADAKLGGLASSVSIEGHSVERFYHFICRGDHDLIQIANQVGIEHKLYWQPTRTSNFYNGHLYPFRTPFDLINFSPIPFCQRIRFGLHVVKSRYRHNWKPLDKLAATPWLIDNLGEETYNVIWKPLIQVKFGDFYKQISAAWMWHRICRVARSRKWLLAGESFGYFENGTQVLVDALLRTLQEMPNFTMHLNASVKSIGITDGKVGSVECENRHIPCDSVISTVALKNLEQVLPQLEHAYFKNIRSIQMIGVVCMLLSLKKPLSNNFWLNINDPRIPHNGIIELTNLNQHYHQDGLNILYMPHYLSTDKPRYHYSDDTLFQENMGVLKNINPSFDPSWVKEWSVFRSPFAQAICTTNFSEKVPAIRSPLRGLYLSDSTQFYPEDRTISAAMRFGRKAASQLMEDFHGA